MVDEGNKAVMRAVTTGPSEAGLTLIETGLTLGEKVVTDGQYRLQPDSPVTTAIHKSANPSDTPHHPKSS